jgi:hypothetical protein
MAADFNPNGWDPSGRNARWLLSNSPSPAVEDEFLTICSLAAVALGYSNDAKAWSRWLDCLKDDGVDFRMLFEHSKPAFSPPRDHINDLTWIKVGDWPIVVHPFRVQRLTRNHRSISAPSFRCRPLRVSGIPMRRESRAFAAEIPKNRRQEKPPKFAITPSRSESSRRSETLVARRTEHFLAEVGDDPLLTEFWDRERFVEELHNRLGR